MLEGELRSFYKSTIKFNTKIQNLDHNAVSELDKKSKKKVAKQINKANERLVKLERSFLQKKGMLIDRPWYKHAIFAPSVKTGLMQVFPSIVESKEIKNLKQIDDVEDSLVNILQNAKGILLRGEPKGHHHRLFNEADEEIIF
jgi:transposase